MRDSIVLGEDDDEVVAKLGGGLVAVAFCTAAGQSDLAAAEDSLYWRACRPSLLPQDSAEVVLGSETIVAQL